MRSKSGLAAAAFFFIFIASSAQAELRLEAASMLSRFRQESVAKKFPDEMRNFDAAIATADMYFHLNDIKNADRFYLLAIQKGNIIQSQLVINSSKSIPALVSAPPPEPPEKQTGKSPILYPATEKPASRVQSPEEGNSPKNATDNPEIATAEDNEPKDSGSDKLIGKTGVYTVQKNETLRLIAAKLGVNRWQLASMNHLDPKSPLKDGQELKYNNRRIIPEQRPKDGILINIPDRTLYYFQKGRLVYTTAVALGTPAKTGKFVWHTPAGKFRIISREKDPTWTVPPSIQEEMRLEGKEVIKSIPPGPGNPLGKYAMKTSLPGILIHSTTKPWSIYTYASHGCIRVYPDKMEELFKVVKVNTPGEIIYRPVKVAVTEQGRILLEVHGDIYAKTKGVDSETKALLDSMKLSERVDWIKAKRAISRKSGVAEDVTLDGVKAEQEISPSTAQSPS